MKQTEVINTLTGERGTLRSIWLNRWTNQHVCRVINSQGLPVDWHFWNIMYVWEVKHV